MADSRTATNLKKLSEQIAAVDWPKFSGKEPAEAG
jgi:hypothetical protein